MEFMHGAVQYFRMQPRYSLCHNGGCLLMLVGVVCFRFIPMCVMGGLIYFFDAGNGVELVFWPTFIFLGLPIGSCILLLGYRIMKYGERFKYSYVFHMGKDYPEPRLDQYDISEEEFHSYERRFSIRGLDSTLSLGASCLSLFLWLICIKMELIDMELIRSFRFLGLLVFATIPIAGMATHVLIQWLNLICARQYPQHEKAERFIEAKRIYEEVQKELRELQSGQTDNA